MPVFILNESLKFPPASLAMPDGLLAMGGDLSVPRLLAAYRRGIFPWFGEGDPILGGHRIRGWFCSLKIFMFQDVSKGASGRKDLK